MAESLREEPPGGPESEAELSQRLARTKARSYGSTASVAAPLAERYVEHRLSAGDTLQGIALKYGVTLGRTPGSIRAKFKEFKTDKHKMVEQFFSSSEC
ncbi:lysM and putative peptidoglycan-binding domain-containing protein 2 isoform X2 [Phalacrocorax carbo]|uniref:lysM and putative peptidoglycan-binding domain-containing protein 2 isoform X2 n=1 Tax=Phalacrocorax carbo TaxID=9209 RepID=UPI00311A12A6